MQVPNAGQTDCVPRMCADPCQDCMEETTFTWICMDMDPTVMNTFDVSSSRGGQPRQSPRLQRGPCCCESVVTAPCCA
jgi:hypothetical protein